MSGLTRSLTVAVVAAASLLAPLPVGHAEPVVDATDPSAALVAAVETTRRTAHRGQLTVVAFGERGPQITELAVEHGAAGTEVVPVGGGQLVRAAGVVELRAADALLRLPGVGPDLAGLERLAAKYEVRRAGEDLLDTGPAEVLALHERATGVRREVVYRDHVSGLLVRRATFDRAGAPVRVVAYTELEVVGPAPVRGRGGGRGAGPTAAELARLRAAGFTVPEQLGAGYHLRSARLLSDAEVVTAHLLYSDGIYALSVFEQPGRLAASARRGAAALPTTDGTVWRWPGSEPRRIVWTGRGRTYTVLSDAPTDELLVAVTGLPIDPGPRILTRLGLGLERLTERLRFRSTADPDPPA